MNPISGDIENPSRAVYGSLSLRERERVRVRATKIFAVLECAGVSPSPRALSRWERESRSAAPLGGPRSVVAANVRDATKRVPPPRAHQSSPGRSEERRVG